MNPRAAVGLPVVLLVLLISLRTPAPAHAVTTFVDQHCNAGGGGYLAGIGEAYNTPVGQTFTPTETDIVSFSLNIYSTKSENTSMTAKILSGGIRGDVLASKDFIVPPQFGLATNGDWFNVTFDNGVQVTPGGTYAFDLTDNSPSAGINWNNCSEAYAGGYGYSVGVPLLNDADFEFMEFSGTFAMEVTPATLTVAPGLSGSSTVKVASFGGFDASVNLTVRDVPAGVTVRFDSNSVTLPARGSASTAVTISVAANATVGTYPITIIGISGSQHPTSILTLIVTVLGDFTISADPTMIIVTQGGSSASKISVGSINGFNSTVSFTASWLNPPPIGLSFIPPHPVTPSPGTNATSQLFVTGSLNASAGLFKLRITGTSGSLSHIFDVTVQVQLATASTTTLSTISSGHTVTPDFSIVMSTTMSLSQGSTAATTVSVTSLNNFGSAVFLSYSWMTAAPSGISIDLPGPITPLPGGIATSTLTVSVSPTSSTGSFTLIVTGTSASLSHATNVAIMISAATGTPAPQCLIATATYGSELSPEVQILRSFRDNSVQKTKAGASFMIVFNAWYYSFSPYAATYLTTHAASRMIMKGVLYPMVAVLLLASDLFTATSTYPEMGVLLSGLFASCLIGAIYIGLPLSLVRAKLQRRREAVTRMLFAALLIAIAGLFVGEVLSSAILMLVAPVIVISSMLLSGVIVSTAIESFS
jgi:hypothetical protein